MLEMKDLKTKSTKELEEMVNKLKEQLFVLRFEKATGQINDPHKFKEIKKDIARVFTAMKMIEGEKSTSKVAKKDVSNVNKNIEKTQEKPMTEEKVVAKEETVGADK